MFGFFSKKKDCVKDASLISVVSAGQKWKLTGNHEDPWGERDWIPVTIIDARDGWVRYDMGGYTFRDERLPEKDFLSMYRKIS